MNKSLKWIWASLLTVVLFVFPLNVLAEQGEYFVSDDTDTLDSYEIEELNTRAKEIYDRDQIGIYVFFTDGLEGSSEDNYVRDLYMNYDLGYGEGNSGVLLAVDLTDRFVDCTAYGAASEVFTVSQINAILDDIAPAYFGNNDWYGGADAFVTKAEEVVQTSGYTYYVPEYTDPIIYPSNATPEPTFAEQVHANPAGYFAGAAGIGSVLGLIIVMIMRSQLKNIGIRRSANEYIEQNGIRLTDRADFFTHTETHRVHIQRDRDGGGGSSFHSSGFSGGGGSTGRHF